MKFKVGDKVKAFKADYTWRTVYIGQVGIITKSLYKYDWLIKYDKPIIDKIAWLERDLELAIRPGEQLEFDW